jgi:hypothetical protein
MCEEMNAIDFAQYSSAFQCILLSCCVHPLDESVQSRESPWLLIENAFYAPLLADLGLRLFGVGEPCSCFDWATPYCARALSQAWLGTTKAPATLAHSTGSTTERKSFVAPDEVGIA